MMVKIQHRKNGNIITVPDFHWEQVLSRQSTYILVEKVLTEKEVPANGMVHEVADEPETKGGKKNGKQVREKAEVR